MTRDRRRAWSRLAWLVSSVVLVLAIVTEFVGVEWWSSVNLTKLEQTYVIIIRGQVHVGVRGTAGSMNRRIPPPGAAWMWSARYSQESWMNRALPRRIREPQRSAVSLPMMPVAMVGAIAALTLRARGRNAGECPRCGYDLSGLAGGACPECGTLERA